MAETKIRGASTLGEKIKLTASDGFQFSGYRAVPDGQVKGAMVVLQEIFGVNEHIRSICHRLAAAGYVSIAPALFDRLQPDFEVGYSNADVETAQSLISKLDWSAVRRDSEAAIAELQKSADNVGALGFCFGGTVAYVLATRVPHLAAATCYYGGQIIRFADKPVHCPVQLHFGQFDEHIPLSDVERIRAARPEAELYTYAANHGFNCDKRESFDGESAAISWGRTLDFLSTRVAKKN